MPSAACSASRSPAQSREFSTSRINRRQALALRASLMSKPHFISATPSIELRKRDQKALRPRRDTHASESFISLLNASALEHLNGIVLSTRTTKGNALLDLVREQLEHSQTGSIENFVACSQSHMTGWTDKREYEPSLMKLSRIRNCTDRCKCVPKKRSILMQTTLRELGCRSAEQTKFRKAC